MSRWTTPLLALLVVGLGFAAWYQGQGEDPDFGRAEFPLFEGFDPTRVVSVHLDNVERSTQVALERDARGVWMMVDPIAYRARPELVAALLRAVSGTAWPVPPGDMTLSQQGLDPPRAVLELRERVGEGKEISHQIEMGAVDLDGMRVFARVGDRVVRTMRSLEVVLENGVTDWRTRRLFDLDANSVVSISRRGFDYSEERQVPLDMDVHRTGANWFIERPVRVYGDPAAIATWGRVLASLQVTKFSSDIEGAPLGAYGLDVPWFSVTLEDRRGLKQTVHFAGPGGTYFCKRDDLPNIWQVEGRDLAAVFLHHSKLYDETITRMFRREVEAILLFGDEALRLTPVQGTGSWQISALGEDGEWGAARPADKGAVELVLSTLEQERIHDYLWEDPVSRWFSDDSSERRGVFVESGGLRQGGWIGPPVQGPGGAPLHAFLRERENVVGLVGEALPTLLDMDRLELQSRFVVAVDEIELQSLRLSGTVDGEERKQAFLRSVQGTWIYPSGDVRVQVEAKELRPILDHLTHLKADRHLPLAENRPLEEQVQVEFVHRSSGTTTVRIGRTASGEVRAQLGQAQSVLERSQLLEDLLQLLL